MDKHLGFLKAASLITKIVSWLLLALGLLGAATMLLGRGPGDIPRWMGAVILVFYSFLFFFFSFVSKLADTVIKIVDEMPVKSYSVS